MRVGGASRPATRSGPRSPCSLRVSTPTLSGRALGSVSRTARPLARGGRESAAARTYPHVERATLPETEESEADRQYDQHYGVSLCVSALEEKDVLIRGLHCACTTSPARLPLCKSVVIVPIS